MTSEKHNIFAECVAEKKKSVVCGMSLMKFWINKSKGALSNQIAKFLHFNIYNLLALVRFFFYLSVS